MFMGWGGVIPYLCMGLSAPANVSSQKKDKLLPKNMFSLPKHPWGVGDSEKVKIMLTLLMDTTIVCGHSLDRWSLMFKG